MVRSMIKLLLILPLLVGFNAHDASQLTEEGERKKMRYIEKTVWPEIRTKIKVAAKYGNNHIIYEVPEELEVPHRFLFKYIESKKFESGSAWGSDELLLVIAWGENARQTVRNIVGNINAAQGQDEQSSWDLRR
jgi:hypothetical protein